MQNLAKQRIGKVGPLPTSHGAVRGWPRWAPYAAVAWSLVYGALGIYWAASGHGFPYAPAAAAAPAMMTPLVGRFGPVVAWLVVISAGVPAAVVGAAMLRGDPSQALRPVFITVGALLAAVLLLLMTDLNLLIMLGYTPYGLVSVLTGAEFGRSFLRSWAEWTVLHQLLCLVGGFLWLAATISYGRRSGGACLLCGRRDGPEGWTSPDRAARWGRVAVYVAMAAPVFYAFTRYAWALGFPLGMSQAQLRLGQERGTWVSGLFLATFGLVGAALMLGLVQRWGEVFPRWMIGLAGRRVPIALAVIPASLVAVLLLVGGLAIWSGYGQLAEAAAASGQALWSAVGPTLLFPLWGAALAVATLGYYYRRRGRCGVCGRGTLLDSGGEAAV